MRAGGRISRDVDRALVAAAIVLSCAAMPACERQDLKEAEKVGDDIRKGVDELEDRAGRNIIDS
ncbi:MAG: hypothetical protein ACRDJV_00435 [Actinomycetota bacterium]